MSVNGNCKKFSSILFDLIQCCDEKDPKKMAEKFSDICSLIISERDNATTSIIQKQTDSILLNTFQLESSDNNHHEQAVAGILELNATTQNHHHHSTPSSSPLQINNANSEQLLNHILQQEHLASIQERFFNELTKTNSRLEMVEKVLFSFHFQLQEMQQQSNLLNHSFHDDDVIAEHLQQQQDSEPSRMDANSDFFL